MSQANKVQNSHVKPTTLSWTSSLIQDDYQKSNSWSDLEKRAMQLWLMMHTISMSWHKIHWFESGFFAYSNQHLALNALDIFPWSQTHTVPPYTIWFFSNALLAKCEHQSDS